MKFMLLQHYAVEGDVPPITECDRRTCRPNHSRKTERGTARARRAVEAQALTGPTAKIVLAPTAPRPSPTTFAESKELLALADGRLE